MKPIPVTDSYKKFFVAGERRSNGRFDTVMKYQLLLNGVDYSGVIENISLGGACLGTCQPKMTKQQLRQEGEIALFVDDGFALSLRCRVTSLSSSVQGGELGEVGVSFIDPDVDAISVVLDTDI